jgi:hypothetical protein
MPAPPPPNTDKQKQAYMQKTFGNNFIPGNEYEHAWTMTNSELPTEGDISALLHSNVVDSHVQTSTIGNDELLTLIQADLPFIHSALAIAKRNEITKKAFGPAFNLMFHSWRDRMLLTKAKEGMENLAQHATGAKHTPQPFGGAYGSGLPQYAQEGQKKGIGDTIRGIFGGKKQG